MNKTLIVDKDGGAIEVSFDSEYLYIEVTGDFEEDEEMSADVGINRALWQGLKIVAEKAGW